MNQANREFIRELYQKYYANRPETCEREACIRCGTKGKLGKRKPYEGLCKACRKKEYNQTQTM